MSNEIDDLGIVAQMANIKAVQKRAQLIHEWDHGKDRYRLVAQAANTPGYKDFYTIEILGQDGLGEPKWSEVHKWKSEGSQSPIHLLVSALESVLFKSR